MLESLRIAWCFLAVPRIARSLLLAPVLLCFFVTSVSLLVSLSLNVPSAQPPQGVPHRELKRNPIAQRLGISPGKELEVCIESDSVACQPDKLDIVVRPEVLRFLPLETIKALFQGEMKALHICSECDSKILIHIFKEKPSVVLKSLQAVILWEGFAFYRIQKMRQQLAKDSVGDPFEEIAQRQFWKFGGRETPFDTSHLGITSVIILNICMTCLVLAWLGIKSHGKVIDYFERNDALAPLIASLGLSHFYGAIWILTLIRLSVFAFFYAFIMYTGRDILGLGLLMDGVFKNSYSYAILWCVVVLLQFCLISLLVSLSEILRDGRATIFLVYSPMIATVGGFSIWLSALGSSQGGGAVVRDFIMAMPLVSAIPHFFTPILQCSDNLLICNAFVSTIMVALVARRNTKIFGTTAIH